MSARVREGDERVGERVEVVGGGEVGGVVGGWAEAEEVRVEEALVGLVEARVREGGVMLLPICTSLLPSFKVSFVSGACDSLIKVLTP